VSIWLGWQHIAGLPAIWWRRWPGRSSCLRSLSAARCSNGDCPRSACCSPTGGQQRLFRADHRDLRAGERDQVDLDLALADWEPGRDRLSGARGFAVVVALSSGFVIRQAKSWNLMAVDPSWAATRGARVTRLTLSGYAAGSVLTAATVALTGPIGFVGLRGPSPVRTRSAPIIAHCALRIPRRGILLAVCDAIGRIVMAPSEVPAGCGDGDSRRSPLGGSAPAVDRMSTLHRRGGSRRAGDQRRPATGAFCRTCFSGCCGGRTNALCGRAGGHFQARVADAKAAATSFT